MKYHLEAVGHKEAFDYIVSLVREKEPLSEFVIKQIHSLVLADKPQDKGVYRVVPVTIMVQNTKLHNHIKYKRKCLN